MLTWWATRLESRFNWPSLKNRFNFCYLRASYPSQSLMQPKQKVWEQGRVCANTMSSRQIQHNSSSFRSARHFLDLSSEIQHSASNCFHYRKPQCKVLHSDLKLNRTEPHLIQSNKHIVHVLVWALEKLHYNNLTDITPKAVHLLQNVSWFRELCREWNLSRESF